MKSVTYNFGSNGTVEHRTSTMQHRAVVTDSGISGTQSTDTIVTTDAAVDSANNRQDLCRCCSKEKCTELVKKRIPIATWLPKYKTHYIPQDILAGITVGLTAIPQGIAYAGVAGLPPQYGLYSGIMGCFVYLLLGSCKDVVIGPTAIMALMIQPHVLAMGPDIAVLACFLSGCIVFVLGIFQLGFLVDFISFPVVSGFTSAAALTIGSSQLKGLFGLKGKSNDFLPAWQAVFEHISEAILADSLLSLGSVAFLVFTKWIGKYGNRKYNQDWTPRRNMLGRFLWIVSLSRNAIIVIFGTFLAWCLSENMKTPFKIIGNVGEGLPPFNLPPFSTEFNNKTYTFEDMGRQLGTTIIFMPLVAILESIAISKAFSKGKSVDATQELIALGLCNIAGSFVRSMSVTGSFTRTALNHNSGAVTTLGGIYTAILVMLALELLTSTFYFIPKATLSSVIIVAMVYMVEIEAAVLLWKTKKLELILYLITLIASLFLGVEYGILIGIATNILFILYASARPSVSLEKTQIGFKDVIIVTPTQSLYFPAAEYMRHKIIDRCEKQFDVVIDGKCIMHIDMTVAKNIKILIEDMQVRDQNVLLWNFKHGVRKNCTDLDPSLDKYFFEGNLENIIRKSSLVQVEAER